MSPLTMVPPFLFGCARITVSCDISIEEVANIKRQFSRYISTSSTTTATSSDLEPPSAPPPPPPPLNIPPSRARRQLAARLALHSKQNAEQNLESSGAEKTEHRKSLNPFATDEDDDSDDEDKDFTIGDLEVEEEGKGHLPPGTGLVGKDEPLLGGEELHEKNVGTQHLAASSSSSSSSSALQPALHNQEEDGTQLNPSGAGSSSTDGSRMRAKFPLLWPFGAKVQSLGGNGNNRNHFRGASQDHADDIQLQSSDDNDSDEDNHDFGGEGQSEGAGGRRRLSVTTEAKRRTSLEDDDEEDEVVHVAMAEAHAEAEGKENDDGELVEIQHAEEK